MREQRRASRGMSLDLWSVPARAIAAGDLLVLEAGCDKSFDMCRSKFFNTLNFRGFPHMPGNDELIKIARAGEPGLDGGSLFR